MEPKDVHDVYDDQDVQEEIYKEIQCIRHGITSIEKTFRMIRNCILFAVIYWVSQSLIKSIFESISEFVSRISGG